MAPRWINHAVCCLTIAALSIINKCANSGGLGRATSIHRARFSCFHSTVPSAVYELNQSEMKVRLTRNLTVKILLPCSIFPPWSCNCSLGLYSYILMTWAQDFWITVAKAASPLPLHLFYKLPQIYYCYLTLVAMCNVTSQVDDSLFLLWT